MLHTKYQGSMPCGLDKKKLFPYINIYACDPRVGHNLNELARGLLDNATYQIFKLYDLWFQTKDVFIFPYISLHKTCDHQGGPILAPGA